MTRRWLALILVLAIVATVTHVTGHSPEALDARLPLRTDQRDRLDACDPVGVSAARRALHRAWLPRCPLPRLRDNLPPAFHQRLATLHRDHTAAPASRLLAGLFLLELGQPSPLLSPLLARHNLDPDHLRKVAVHHADPSRLDPTLADEVALHLWMTAGVRPEAPERLLRRQDWPPDAREHIHTLAHQLWQEQPSPDEQRPRLRGLSADAATVRASQRRTEACDGGPSPACTDALRATTPPPTERVALHTGWPPSLGLSHAPQDDHDHDLLSRWGAWLSQQPRADRAAALAVTLTPSGAQSPDVHPPASDPASRLHRRAGGPFITAWTASLLGELSGVEVSTLLADELVVLRLDQVTLAMDACGALHPTPPLDGRAPLSRDALLAHAAYLEAPIDAGLGARLLGTHPDNIHTPAGRAGARLGLTPRKGSLQGLGPGCATGPTSPSAP